MIVLSVFLSLLFFAGYYLLCAAAFLAGGAGPMLKSVWRDKRSLAAALAIALGSTAFVWYWVCQDRFVYYWDYSGYWKISINQVGLLFSDPGSALKQLAASIAQSDYNCLLPTIAALPLKLTDAVLGGSYRQYVITNHIVFMIPAILGQALCIEKLCSRLFPQEAKGPRLFAAGALIAALLPASYYALLHGYMDAGILLPMSAAVFLLLDYDLTAPFTRKSQWRDLLFSFTLLLAWLSRRYAAYFIVGIAVSMFFLAAMQLISKRKADRALPPAAKGNKSQTARRREQAQLTANKRANKRMLLCACAHLGYIGAVSLAVLLLFFRSFFLKALLTDYGTAYAAYNGSFIDKLLAVSSSFGVCALFAAVLSAAYCLIRKTARSTVLSLLILTAVSMLSFFTVQSMGEHHRYIIVIPLCLFEAVSIMLLFRHGTAVFYRVLSGLCCLAFIANFAYAFLPPVRPVLAAGKSALCEAYAPMQRNDIDELERLRGYLLEKTQDDEKLVYVLASSGILNDDIIRCLDLPDSLTALPTLLLSNHVDLRDGFPIAFLQADVVVTTDPIQTHLASGTQEVVRYLAQEVQDSASPVGRHFAQDPQTFTLDGSVTVRIYERVTPWEVDDLVYLRDYFASCYPDQPALFSQRLEQYID